jgi:hypothetical protein
MDRWRQGLHFEPMVRGINKEPSFFSFPVLLDEP